MIGAGIPNPMLFSGGDPLDELGKIDKSLRLRASASSSLSRTPAAAGSQTAWTISGWFKRGVVATSTIFGCAPNNQNYMSLGFGFALSGAEKMEFIGAYGNVVQFRLQTTQVFRDPSAWYHVVAVYDSANATASDRVRLYINGVRVTAFDATTYPAQNYAFPYINTTSYAMYLSSGLPYYASQYFDGMLACVAFTDGLALDASYFGKFHPKTNQWRPKSRAAIKAVVDAGGINSFFLPFDDATNLTTLCADASAKGSNWTANNISLTAGVTYDSMLDTPTNNFPVINPIYAAYGSIAGVVSDGGLKFASSTTYHFTPCTIPLPNYGKWQAEFIPQDTAGFIGLADIDNGSGASQNIGGGYGWYGSALWTGNSVVVQSGLAAMAANDIITVTADMGALSMKIYKNGTLVCTQALSAGKRYAFACGDYHSSAASSCYANFGQRAFGYPQAGFSALSTKNLKIPAVSKSKSAFVAVTDSGANIAATLAAAAPFSNWIKIYKRRDAAEGWRWQFSDDAANYMDSSSTAAKAAFPALSGTSYVGYALNVSAVNGIATGRLTHVNGVADVVTDGLSNVRKVVILVNEAGSNWFLYHPDLTAGKLIYLNGLNPTEFADTTISAVNGSGFTVAAALPSGTYRWMSIAEISGFSAIGKTVGNGAADGPFFATSFSPAFLLHKGINISVYWGVHDVVRDPKNLATKYIYPGLNNAEVDYGSAICYDINSNGVKTRGTDNDINGAGYNYIFLAFASFPFRYANAR